MLQLLDLSLKGKVITANSYGGKLRPNDLDFGFVTRNLNIGINNLCNIPPHNMAFCRKRIAEFNLKKNIKDPEQVQFVKQLVYAMMAMMQRLPENQNLFFTLQIQKY